MKKLFSSFSSPFQANFLLPTLGILVRNHPYIPLILPLYTPYFTPTYPIFYTYVPLVTSVYPYLPLYDVIHTLHLHASERILLI